MDCAVYDVKWIRLRGPVLTNYCADYLAVCREIILRDREAPYWLLPLSRAAVRRFQWNISGTKKHRRCQ